MPVPEPPSRSSAPTSAITAFSRNRLRPVFDMAPRGTSWHVPTNYGLSDLSAGDGVGFMSTARRGASRDTFKDGRRLDRRGRRQTRRTARRRRKPREPRLAMRTLGQLLWLALREKMFLMMLLLLDYKKITIGPGIATFRGSSLRKNSASSCWPEFDFCAELGRTWLRRNQTRRDPLPLHGPAMSRRFTNRCVRG